MIPLVLADGRISLIAVQVKMVKHTPCYLKIYKKMKLRERQNPQSRPVCCIILSLKSVPKVSLESHALVVSGYKFSEIPIMNTVLDGI